MGFTLGDDVVVVPIPDAWGAVVDAELALLDRSSRRATLLNASAALIYTAFDGERPLRAVIDQLVGETGGDRASIARDVESTVARLVAAGIVDVGAPVADPPSDDPGAGAPEDGDPGRQGDPEQIHEEHLAEHGPWALARDLTVGGTTCRLRVEDASLAEVVGPLVSSLPEAPAEELAHTMSLVTLDRADAGRFRLVVDGRVATDDADRDQAIVQLLHELDDLAASEAGEALTFHAGAVARDGRAILVAGQSGRGKSTLTGALVRRGWSYLTDEVTVVRLEDHRILPYPKALDLDDGSRKLLRIRRAAVDLGAAKQKVLPTRLGRVGTGATPRWSWCSPARRRGRNGAARRSSGSPRPKPCWPCCRSPSSARSMPRSASRRSRRSASRCRSSAWIVPGSPAAWRPRRPKRPPVRARRGRSTPVPEVPRCRAPNPRPMW